MIGPHYLLAHDFDMSAAQTGKPGPSGKGVKEVYAAAIETIWPTIGLEIYNSKGGLGNRAPPEIAHDILMEGDTLVQLAYDHYVRQTSKRELRDTRGNRLQWDEDNLLYVVTEMLVDQKMRQYREDIGGISPDGTRWPQPCDGFIGYWETIQELNNTGQVHITTAIISSGHDEFIEKTFKMWDGLKQPDIRITDDGIRYRQFPTELTRRVKPGALPMALAHHQWLKQLGIQDETFTPELARQTREHIMYGGDDLRKDGGMAGPILFTHFNPEADRVYEEANILTVNNWGILAERLIDNFDKLRSGEPLRNALLVEPRQQVEGQLVSMGGRR